MVIGILQVWAWREGHLRDIVLYWAVPAQLAVAALALTFDYWPHRPHTERGRFKDTANILPGWLDPFFLCQNLHAVHHLFPQLPWYRYRAALGVIDDGLKRERVPQWGFREAVSKLKPGPLPYMIRHPLLGLELFFLTLRKKKYNVVTVLSIFS